MENLTCQWVIDHVAGSPRSMYGRSFERLRLFIGRLKIYMDLRRCMICFSPFYIPSMGLVDFADRCLSLRGHLPQLKGDSNLPFSPLDRFAAYLSYKIRISVGHRLGAESSLPMYGRLYETIWLFIGAQESTNTSGGVCLLVHLSALRQEVRWLLLTCVSSSGCILTLKLYLNLPTMQHSPLQMTYFFLRYD